MIKSSVLAFITTNSTEGFKQAKAYHFSVSKSAIDLQWQGIRAGSV